jgi:hypothetical protein
MSCLLRDYDKYMSVLVDDMPVFDIVECIKMKKENEKSFYYQFFNT